VPSWPAQKMSSQDKGTAKL